MGTLELLLDKKAEKSLKHLMIHYDVNSKAKIIRKALALLQIAAKVERLEGKLIARKDEKETEIIVR